MVQTIKVTYFFIFIMAICGFFVCSCFWICLLHISLNLCI